MNYQKILVIGGAGFIGTNLVRHLTNENLIVRVFTRSSRSVKNLSTVRDKIELTFGDIMDEVALRKALTDIDCVIHLVSTTFPGTSIDSGIYDIFSNLIPTIRLLEICAQNKLKKIIYASSGGTIYGEPTIIPILEEHYLDPKSMYGQSKKTVEGYLNFFAKNYDLNIQILRLSNPYGPFQNPYGAQGLVGVAFRCALENSTCKVFGNGESVRDYIYIGDVIDAFECALEAQESETLNISSGEGKSVMDVLAAVEEVSGRSIRKEYVSERRGDVAVNILSNSKALEVYGWKPRISFESGLSKTWKWILKEFHTTSKTFY
jgi:UDP-glucose 4-epimerase